MNRLNWHEYFMQITQVVAQRSTCLRRQVGAIIVRNKQILSTGYNGSPKGLEHCKIKGCLRQELQIPSGQRHEICRAVHAEQNAVIQAAVNGVSISGAVLYCTNSPCSICAKILVNAEIKKIYVADDYQDDLAKQILQEAGVELIHLKLES